MPSLVTRSEPSPAEEERKVATDPDEARKREALITNQRKQIQIQQTSLKDKESQLTRMHQLMSLQSQKLEELESEKNRQVEILKSRNFMTSDVDGLHGAVASMQLAIDQRDTRINQLTSDLQGSVEQYRNMASKVSSLTLKLED
eukprot:Sspe_Gene.118487::Locus_112106_Transcript_1_1_Confidence_1.000_Length_484::g.118487::m.118487